MIRNFVLALIVISATYFCSDRAAAQRIILSHRLAGSGPDYSIREHFAFGRDYFFTTYSNTLGSTLYKIDGHTGSVSLVYQWPLPSTSFYEPMSPVEYMGKLWFAQKDTAGLELWTSDGTSSGTTRFLDLQPGAGNGVESTIYGFPIHAGRLYFIATMPGSRERTLWRTDGTSTGTELVYRLPSYGKEIGGAYSIMPSMNGKITFFGADTINKNSLYQSDGTAAGTYESIPNFSGQIGVFWNNHVLSTIWPPDSTFITDGSSKRLLTTAILSEDHFSTPDAFYFFDRGLLYEVEGAGAEIRLIFSSTDGSGMLPRSGNRIFNGMSHSYAYLNGDLYFISDTSLYQYRSASRQLRRIHAFKSQYLTDLSETHPPSPFCLTALAGKVYVKAQSGYRMELYEVDPQYGTTQMIPVPGANYRSPDLRNKLNAPVFSDPMIAFNNRLYYTAGYDSSIGVALYMLEYPTGIPENPKASTELTLAPNPATGSVTLSLPEGRTIRSATITDASGQTVYSKELPPLRQTTIDVRSLATGAYTVTTQHDQGAASRQFVITK